MQLRNEAEHCRELAPEFVGRPEQPFLLKLAVAFEDLAQKKRSSVLRIK